MLNMRCRNDYYRMVSTSDDGGLTWTTPVASSILIDPICQASLLNAQIDGSNFLFFSNPASSTSRENMTIRKSVDDGETWTANYKVYKGLAAYSDMVQLSSSQIGILYEAGSATSYDGIAFKTIKVGESD